MIKVVAAGLAPGSQPWELAVPLPPVGSAEALALVCSRFVFVTLTARTPAGTTLGSGSPRRIYHLLFTVPWGFTCPPMGRRALAASASPSSILPQGRAGPRHQRRRDGLQSPLSLCVAKGVIDKQVSALKEKCCSMFEAASLINTQPWLSPLPTGFQMTAAGVIRALGSTVSEIITG